MEKANHRKSGASADVADSKFPPLEQVTRPAVETAAAAYYLNRQQQTLRGWACCVFQ